MSRWTDMDALCEALRRTESREEAIRVVRFAPAPPANDPEVA